MKLVNRSVLVLKPTAKMLDWINSMGEESAAVTPEEAQEMTNAYLLPDFEDDWFDYRLENDPRFLKRIESARNSLRAGKGIRLENI
jgi:hypothetical protein